MTADGTRRIRRDSSSSAGRRARNDRLPVSILLPVRDEDPATVARAVASALAQGYGGEVEVVLADGSDTTATADSIRREFPEVRVIPNPERTIPSGLNRAMRAARRRVLARCDARTVLPPGYLERAVEQLCATGAAVVGGRQNPVGKTAFERAVALAMTSPLGAGDARYRLGGPAGPTDTVYLGVLRRDAVEAAGGYETSLLWNSEYELYWRLRQHGEIVWFDPTLAADYRPRGAFAALARQYFRYGRWKRAMLRRHPASLRWRQLAAPLLVLAALASLFLAAAGWVAAATAAPSTGTSMLGAAALVPALYLLLLLGGAALVGARRRALEAALLPLVLPTIHFSWGIGFLVGPPRGRDRPPRV